MDGHVPLVSVIVTVYNMDLRLYSTLEALRTQDLEDAEFILVDDGSTDCSFAICRRFAERDGRFRVLTGPNCGLSAALNRGLDAARGRWVGFCDADDCVHHDIYTTLVGLAEREDAELPSVALRIVSVDGTIPGVTDFPIRGDAETIRGRENVLSRAFYPLLAGAHRVKGYRVTCLFRRDLIEERHIRFCPCMCEDEMFMLDYLLSVNAIAVVRRDEYDYIRISSSICSTFFRGSDDYRREHSWYLQSRERERIFANSGLAASSPRTLARLRFLVLYHEAQDVCCDRSLTRRARRDRLNGIRRRVRALGDAPDGLGARMFRACILRAMPLLPLLLRAKRRRDKIRRRLEHVCA